MTNRKHNFNAGPTVLPLSVLETVQSELLNFKNTGMSLMEMSHRTPVFDDVIVRAKASISKLYSIPDTHEVMFLQGGAALQFAMIPLNFGSNGAYIDTGVWSSRAIEEAKIQGDPHVLYSGQETRYTGLPDANAIGDMPVGTPFLHYTSNNTIYGTQFHYTPQTNVPLICDMSSDFISRPIDVSTYDLIYAGAQKNAGPSGVTILIINKAISRNFKGSQSVPKIMRYETQAKKDSMYNTPNTFGIWVIGLVADWVLSLGGLDAMAARNQKKATLLYETLDQLSGYETVADNDARSLMNVTFKMESPEADKAFVVEADRRGIVGLKGHRSVGGLRASIYNAVEHTCVEALCQLLRDMN
jgi:phosphoserine aminotransferase